MWVVFEGGTTGSLQILRAVIGEHQCRGSSQAAKQKLKKTSEINASLSFLQSFKYKIKVAFHCIVSPESVLFDRWKCIFLLFLFIKGELQN